jgi:hypothetical protein
MTLISEHNKNNIKFYNGIDFEYAKSFPNDGSEGMCVFLIESWISEVKKWKRSKKLEYILNNKKFDLDHNIDNNYVVIYQTNGELDKIYNILLEKFNI